MKKDEETKYEGRAADGRYRKREAGRQMEEDLVSFFVVDQQKQFKEHGLDSIGRDWALFRSAGSCYLIDLNFISFNFIVFRFIFCLIGEK